MHQISLHDPETDLPLKIIRTPEPTKSRPHQERIHQRIQRIQAPSYHFDVAGQAKKGVKEGVFCGDK